MGSVALHWLGRPDMRITRDRGMWFRTEQGFDCIATYHPAYLLRQYGKQLVASKWDVFHDLEAARERAALLAPGYEFMSEEKPDLFKIFKKYCRKITAERFWCIMLTILNNLSGPVFDVPNLIYPVFVEFRLVGNKQNTALEFLQCTLQLVFCVNIKMVSRFVQYQPIDILQH